MVCGRTGALMTATLVTGGVDGVAYRDPPPKFTFTDTRLNNGLRLIVAAAPKGYLGGAEGQTRLQAALRVDGCRIAQSEYVCADCLQRLNQPTSVMVPQGRRSEPAVDHHRPVY